jgi:cyclophilin family peptidyl-prolyl cis-trans isomerase
MPHTSKKARKSSVPRQNNNRLTIIIVAAIIAIIAGAGGYYFYSSAQHSSSTPTSTTISSSSGLVYAVFNTTQGTFEAELFQNATPKTVANFVSLANSGFYNNLVWHRIVNGFVIQTGDPNTRGAAGNPCNWGQGGSTTSIPFEYVPSLHNDYGYLGMASTAAKAPGTSQFYINLANNTSLDGSYAVFGKVISGMNVVKAIGELPVSSACQSSGGSPPANPSQAILISVTIQDTP